MHRLAIHGNDQVAAGFEIRKTGRHRPGLHAGLVCRPVGDNIRNVCAGGALQTERIDHIQRQIVLRGHAQVRVSELPCLDQFRDHAFDRVDGNGIPDPGGGAALDIHLDCPVDTHHLAVQVEQGTAGVAMVEQGIRLDDITGGIITLPPET